MTLLASALPSSSLNLKGSPGKYVDSDNFKKQLIGISERVEETVPKPLRDFPWKEAENLLLQRLMSLGKTVLKWPFVAWFTFSSSSDVLTSIASNQELMVPLGLLVGCLTCDFLKETASKMLPGPEEKGLSWQFFGISFFFVVVKFVSAFSESRTQMFLLHFGNGGILQLLWLFSGPLWRASSKSEQNYNPDDASK